MQTNAHVIPRDFEDDIPTVPTITAYRNAFAEDSPMERQRTTRVLRTPERENNIATAILVSIALVIAAIAVAVCWSSSIAHADTGSGSAIAAAAQASVPAAAAAQLPDPTVDPMAYLSELEVLWHQSWSAALSFGVWGVLELLTLASGKQSKLAFLNKGRWKIFLAGAVGASAAALKAALGSGTWVAVMTAIIAAIFLAFNTSSAVDASGGGSQ